MNLSSYVRDIQSVHASGKATEHSYRESLRNLLASAQNGLTVINEPKRIEVGAPDFIIERAGVPLGFVEAKDVDEDLDRLDRRSKKQLDDYRAALPNLIHTNYLHFRWYVGGQLIEDFSLGALKNGKIEIQRERFDDVAGMLSRFVEQVAPTISSPEELAKRMAAMTRQIATLINNSLPSSETLKNQMAAFESTLIPGIKTDEFADMYAQTLAYGLFAARVRYGAKPPEDFTLQNAFWNLPDTNPFLRRFFQEIAPELDDRVRWQAETLAALLAHAQMDDILRDFGRRTRTEDPVVHFYETFLREYDPAKREQRGVYYTPEPVVSYIVRSVDHLLRTRFGRDGLADPQTLILDPATGTGTFLYFVIQHIYESLAGQKGMWNAYVRDHLLPRLFGFELLMAPYAVAHMKLGIQLQETGYTFSGGQRLGVYLTNTLEEMTKPGQQQFAQFINREANEATAIKREKPIMVVLGNPPYSGHSANKGEWIDKLVRDYYQVDGKPLGKRNPKWLQDDYVKFIRFGQWRINETHSGILAFVTNHGYLDNPTFRGMRQQLMSAFTDIYILNLHGNSRKKEKTPDGGKDENVFDIQQGVAIGIFVKNAPVGAHGARPAQVHHADLYGLRDEKYETLLETDLSTTDWQTFTPQPPFYLFTPQNLDLKGEYETGWKINDTLPINSTGMKTHRDHFVIDFDESILEQRISEFRDLSISDEDISQKYQLGDTRDWKLNIRRKSLGEVETWRNYLQPILYRPFDIRSIFNHSDVIELPRSEVMRHMIAGNNLAICTSRNVEIGRGFEHIFLCTTVVDHHAVSLKESNYFFPLYLYPAREANKLFDAEGDWPPGKDGRVPNLNPKFIREMEGKLDLRFVPEALTPGPSPAGRGEAKAGGGGSEAGRGGSEAGRGKSEAGRGEHNRSLRAALSQDAEHFAGVRASENYREMASRAMAQIAAELRQRQTPAEELLWEALRNRRLNGLKFRRQHPIAGTTYVVDFLCYETRLVIELDGGIHARQAEADALRQSEIEALGYRIIRFPNEQVMNDLAGVLMRISEAVLTAQPPASASPLPASDSPLPASDSPLPAGEGPGVRAIDTGERPTEVPAGEGPGVRAATFTPEDVFHYAYAVFHSPTYRERYAEFLKIDFPRLPLTSDKELFRALCEKGAALVDLHLLRGGNFQLQTTFPESGDNIVAPGYPKYTPLPQGEGPGVRVNGRVYINKQQYFGGIAPEVWDFHVGGYQVLEKWLKDRRGRVLTYQDIMHYQRVVVALANTIRLMAEIDDLIPAWPLT